MEQLAIAYRYATTSYSVPDFNVTEPFRSVPYIIMNPAVFHMIKRLLMSWWNFVSLKLGDWLLHRYVEPIEPPYFLVS